MAQLADVLRRHGPSYVARYGDRLLPSHRRALRDLVVCRTPAMGAHVARCDSCGQWHSYYHSCRNRSCPTCYQPRSEAWLAQQRARLLPVPYFHVVFTLPDALRRLVRGHQRILLNVLFVAAAQSLMRLCADPRYVGGRIGILAVLHTWTRALLWHPHIHCLVPGGGLTDAGCWQCSRKRFLVPVRALSELFRARFMALARKALPAVRFPEQLWQTRWVVYSKPTVQGADRVLAYLGRYVHRVAITNRRILALNDRSVTFSYRDSRDDRYKRMTLEAFEFVRRFLQHVLPQGFHKVRNYGLLSPARRDQLDQLQQTLGQPSQSGAKGDKGETTTATGPSWPCPHCGKGLMVVVAIVSAPSRGPP